MDCQPDIQNSCQVYSSLAQRAWLLITLTAIPSTLMGNGIATTAGSKFNLAMSRTASIFFEAVTRIRAADIEPPLPAFGNQIVIFPALSIPANGHRAMPLTPEQLHYSFTSNLS